VHLNFSFSDRANDVAVDFRVKLPAGVAFVANNENGAVRAHGLTGPIKAHTVNGECELETAGACEASTVNGSVHATLGRLAPHDHLDFSTVNGSITLALPAAADADL
jgi:DUF4097 and DUF4098 domain-containing protein YvlB